MRWVTPVHAGHNDLQFTTECYAEIEHSQQLHTRNVPLCPQYRHILLLVTVRTQQLENLTANIMVILYMQWLSNSHRHRVAVAQLAATKTVPLSWTELIA